MRMITREETIAIAVDYQERLMPAIHDNEELAKKTVRLIEGLKVHDVPVILTTQYAKGLGNTVDVIWDATGRAEPIDKNTFSCYGNVEFCNALEKTGRKHALVFGVESHICVQKTVLDLLDAGYGVTVVEDCCSSRNKRDHDVAMRRMSSQGAIVTTYESILFELMDGSKDPGFKEISSIVK